MNGEISKWGHNGAPRKIVFTYTKLKFNHIRRDIEVVITGLTRNFSVLLELTHQNPLIYKGFSRCEYNLICLFSPTVLSDFREQMA